MDQVPVTVFSHSRSLEEEDFVELESDHFNYLFFGISGSLSSKNRNERRMPPMLPDQLFNLLWYGCIVPVNMFLLFRSIQLYHGKRPRTREKLHCQFLHFILKPMQHCTNGCKICTPCNFAN